MAVFWILFTYAVIDIHYIYFSPTFKVFFPFLFSSSSLVKFFLNCFNGLWMGLTWMNYVVSEVLLTTNFQSDVGGWVEMDLTENIRSCQLP